VQGAQWELGAVSNAQWTGVSLRALLERAGLVEDACEIVLEGADRGTPKEEPIPLEPISYTWSLPRAKAIQPEVLIAHQMNGRDLSRDHGFPARAVVPGHYGTASVKWLARSQAVREPFHGYWQTTDYPYWASMDGKPVRRGLGKMQLKSEIARPRMYKTLAPNRIYTISGAAWAGETDVIEIAVSADGGQTLTWADAEFLRPPIVMLIVMGPHPNAAGAFLQEGSRPLLARSATGIRDPRRRVRTAALDPELPMLRRRTGCGVWAHSSSDGYRPDGASPVRKRVMAQGRRHRETASQLLRARLACSI
jgi:hypothetical protein